MWWKQPLDRVELLWIVLALAWCLIMFFMMPYWHIYGQQNLSNEAYRSRPEDFVKKTEAMIAQYKVREDGGDLKVPVVRPPAGSDVYVVAQLWCWYPVLEPEAGKSYRIHLMSLDWLHGFSLQPENPPGAATLPQLVADFGFRYESTAAGFDHLVQASIVDAHGRIYRQVYGDSFEVPLFVGPLPELEQGKPVPPGQRPGFLPAGEIAVHRVRAGGGALPGQLCHRRRAARGCEHRPRHPQFPRRRAAAPAATERDDDAARRVTACAVAQCAEVVARSRSPSALSTFRTVAISGLPSGDRDL